jgi:hypothetical protein
MLLAAAICSAVLPIQSGTSPGGLQWQLSACESHHTINVDMNIPAWDGWGMALPLTAGNPLGVDHAEDAGPANETVVEGCTFKTVARLKVYSAKRTFNVTPTPAPAGAVRRWPELEDARFYVLWFATDDVPRKLTALSKGGKPLAHFSLKIRSSGSAVRAMRSPS